MQSLGGRVGVVGLFFCTSVAIACGSSSSPDPSAPGGANGSGSDAATPGDDDSGVTGTNGGDAGPAGSDVFWYITSGTREVGVADLTGTASFSEMITDEPIGLVLGGGSAWVLTDTGSVVRYDLASHAKVATIAAVKTPGAMIYAAGALWLAENDDGSMDNCTMTTGTNKLVRVDPATNMVAKAIVVPGSTGACNRFDGLASDGTNVYALLNNDFSISRIDPSTMTITGEVGIGALLDDGGSGYGGGEFALANGVFWAENTYNKQLVQVDAASLTVTSKTPIMSGFDGDSLVATSDAVYIPKPDGAIVRIDAKDPTKQVVTPVVDSSPDSMFVHGGVLYATYTEDPSDGEIITYDLTTLQQIHAVTGLVFPNVMVFVDGN